MTRHTLSVLVEDKPGVLARVASLFSRRGFNIESLAVGPTEIPDVSRMTIVVSVERLLLEQVTKQLNKLINVLKIVELDESTSVQRALALVKVRADAESRSSVLEIVQLFRAKVVDVATDAVTIEVTGDEPKIEALLRLLEPYGIKELVESGVIALGRGSRASMIVPCVRLTAPHRNPYSSLGFPSTLPAKGALPWLSFSTTPTLTCRSFKIVLSPSWATAVRGTHTP